MIKSFQKQSPIKSLAPVSIDRNSALKETDLNEVVRTAESFFPLFLGGNGDMDLNITLLEKNLKIMADSALMKDALLYLFKNAVDAMPDGGTFSLSTNQVNFGKKSGLDDDNRISGACALLSIAHTGAAPDEKIKEKMFEPFLSQKPGNGNGNGLGRAYAIINQHHGSMKVENVPGGGAAIKIYIPLAKLKEEAMEPIPLAVSYEKQSFSEGW
jgi:C4-dicarboxylate-specific signal transduction histidine kinase